MRKYLNTETENIYSKLQSDLKDIIILTSPVISGSGPDGVSLDAADYLYLLALKEVGFSSGYDTKRDSTKILKYYSDNNNNAARIKYDTATGSESSGSWYYLRSACSNYGGNIYVVDHDGSDTFTCTKYSGGVAPAFRILD
ncbi:MAG: hypothetical protein J6B64_01935 [Bacilli bacterium]|nr:hypothetical protein [Bacilli bacterium]MBP3921316.1 hypothetical protein [Bacilli bacterium]